MGHDGGGHQLSGASSRLSIDAFARSFLDELADYRERGEDPFSDRTPSQTLTKLGAAARALQHAQQVERLARGVSADEVGGAEPIPPHIERKSEQELVEWLTGRRSAARDAHPARSPRSRTTVQRPSGAEEAAPAAVEKALGALV